MINKKLRIILSLILFLLALNTNNIYAEDDSNLEYGHLFWGVHDNTLYLSPTLQGYAVNQDDDGLLSFGEDWLEMGGLWLGKFNDPIDNSSIIKVEILSSGDVKITPKGMGGWFYNFSGLKEINGLENIDYSMLKCVSSLFKGCESLEYISTPLIDTTNVLYMGSMFSGCSSLKEIDVFNWNTKNVKVMNNLFSNCSSLKEIDVSNWDTRNVENVSAMFSGCESIKNIDISTFNPTKSIWFNHVFSDCYNLETVKLPSNGIAVSTINNLFNNCYNLKAVDLSNFTIKSNKYSRNSFCKMFNNCSSLEKIDISSFNTDDVDYMESMFSGCSSLKEIIIGDGWTTKNLTDNGVNMFTDCINLVGPKGTKYDANHVDASYAHVDGGEVYPGYLTLLKKENKDNEITDESIKPNDTKNNSNSFLSLSISNICIFAIPLLFILLIIGVICIRRKK